MRAEPDSSSQRPRIRRSSQRSTTRIRENNASDAPCIGAELDFERLFREKRGLIYESIRKFHLPSSTQDDIVQDTFVRGIENRQHLKNSGAAVSWLLAIARNACLVHLRDTKDEIPILGTDGGLRTCGEGPSTALVRNPMESYCLELSLSALRDLIQGYAKSCRARVVELYYRDGLDTAEISISLKMSQNTVLSHLLRFRSDIAVRMRAIVETTNIFLGVDRQAFANHAVFGLDEE